MSEGIFSDDPTRKFLVHGERKGGKRAEIIIVRCVKAGHSPHRAPNTALGIKQFWAEPFFLQFSSHLISIEAGNLLQFISRFATSIGKGFTIFIAVPLPAMTIAF